MNCPECGAKCGRDEVDVGVGLIYGPWGCWDCGWSEESKYDLRDGPRFDEETGGEFDQFGGLTPKGGKA